MCSPFHPRAQQPGAPACGHMELVCVLVGARVRGHLVYGPGPEAWTVLAPTCRALTHHFKRSAQDPSRGTRWEHWRRCWCLVNYRMNSSGLDSYAQGLVSDSQRTVGELCRQESRRSARSCWVCPCSPQIVQTFCGPFALSPQCLLHSWDVDTDEGRIRNISIAADPWLPYRWSSRPARSLSPGSHIRSPFS